MASTHTALRFAQQDDETLALLARVQRETGYVPTTEELGQLLQCPTTSEARIRLDEMITNGDSTRLTSAELQEMAETTERLQRNEAPCMQRRKPDGYPIRTEKGIIVP